MNKTITIILISLTIGFVIVSASNVNVPCIMNSQCGEGYFCELGDCVFPGVCKERPLSCTMMYEPVCGCDGKTYLNDCKRESNGISLRSYGVCPPLTGDVNGDGILDVADVQSAINEALGLSPKTEAADINKDGIVDIFDVQKIINIVQNSKTKSFGRHAKPNSGTNNDKKLKRK